MHTHNVKETISIIFTGMKISAPKKNGQNDTRFFMIKYNIVICTGLQNQSKRSFLHEKIQVKGIFCTLLGHL